MLNSVPENKLTGVGDRRLSSSKVGAIKNSDRAFSVLIARAKGIFSARMRLRSSLGAIASTWANRSIFSSICK